MHQKYHIDSGSLIAKDVGQNLVAPLGTPRGKTMMRGSGDCVRIMKLKSQVNGYSYAVTSNLGYFKRASQRLISLVRCETPKQKVIFQLIFGCISVSYQLSVLLSLTPQRRLVAAHVTCP